MRSPLSTSFRMTRIVPWILLAWLLLPVSSPAPLIYTPGEGWTYQPVGQEGKWTRTRADEQLKVAKDAFEEKRYGLALKAARRTVNVWPFSDYAPEAQYLVGRCQEAKGKDEAAFKAYQKVIERYPKLDNYDDIVRSQFEIANRFLAGQWFRLWNVIPVYPSMDKTITLYEQIIKNGPYSDIAPKAQMNIAQAHKDKLNSDLEMAAKAYEKAADRYSDKSIGVDALYSLAETYQQMAGNAEYDQSLAARAIATYTDFVTLHPTDPRVSKAREMVRVLKTEQARGSFDIARFYEKNKKWRAAAIYYNDVVDKDPTSQYAQQAREKIDAINKRQDKDES